MVVSAALIIVGAAVFQYSLCRVVLMVEMLGKMRGGWAVFQYSLCRVVLMVPTRRSTSCLRIRLSVLALSSRFDGPG